LGPNVGENKEERTRFKSHEQMRDENKKEEEKAVSLKEREGADDIERNRGEEESLTFSSLSLKNKQGKSHAIQYMRGNKKGE